MQGAWICGGLRKKARIGTVTGFSTLAGMPVCVESAFNGSRGRLDVTRGGYLGRSGTSAYTVGGGYWCVCRMEADLQADRASFDVPAETAHETLRLESTLAWTVHCPLWRFEIGTSGAGGDMAGPGKGARVIASGGRWRRTPRPSPGLVFFRWNSSHVDGPAGVGLDVGCDVGKSRTVPTGGRFMPWSSDSV